MKTMIVNGKRYLINPLSPSCEKTIQDILDHYPADAVVEFEEATLQDVQREIYTWRK
tara:strand:- start:363 stop:533 length:171 start_codon:yes stop_codon:yes gene_type:complete